MAEHTIPDWDAHCLRAKGMSKPRAPRETPRLIEGSTIYQLYAVLGETQDYNNCKELENATDAELVYLVLSMYGTWERAGLDQEAQVRLLEDLELLYFDSHQDIPEIVARIQGSTEYDRGTLEDVAIEVAVNG